MCLCHAERQADVKQVCEGGMHVCLETPARLSGGVSLEPINQRLVDRWELSPSPSDNGGEDIVFPLLKYCRSQEQDHIIVL